MDVNLQLFGGRGGSSGVATASSMQDTYTQMSVAKQEAEQNKRQKQNTPPNEFFTSDEMDELSLMTRGKVTAVPSTVTDQPDFVPNGKVTAALVASKQNNLTDIKRQDTIEAALSKLRAGDTLRLDLGDGRTRNYTKNPNGSWRTTYNSRGHTIGYSGTIHGVSDDIIHNISNINADDLANVVTVSKRTKTK